MSQKGRATNLTYRSVLVNMVIAERMQGGAASDLFKLAKQAEDQDSWEGQCRTEEDWLMSDAAGQMKCHELPKAWTQARSDIRGAFKAGLDLSKIPSYHKMKIRKAEANAAKQEAKAPETQVAVEVPVHAAEAVVAKMRHVPTGKDQRGPRRDTVRSVEDALADGEVVDAKSNLICPPELVEYVHALNKLNEHARARCIKHAIKEARDANAQQRQSVKRGGGRGGYTATSA